MMAINKIGARSVMYLLPGSNVEVKLKQSQGKASKLASGLQCIKIEDTSSIPLEWTSQLLVHRPKAAHSWRGEGIQAETSRMKN